MPGSTGPTPPPSWSKAYLKERGHGGIAPRRMLRFIPSGTGLAVDIGTGSGWALPRLAKKGYTALGIDINRRMFSSRSRRSFCLGDCQELPLADDSVQVAVMAMSLHQIPDKTRALDELARVLEPGGSAWILTRSHGQLRRSIFSRFPGLLNIDLARFPSIPWIRDIWAGRVRARIITCNLSMRTEAFLKKIRGRYLSTFAMMDDRLFRRSYRRFARRLHDEHGEWLERQADFTILRLGH